MIELVDSHAHIPICKETEENVIKEAQEAGVIQIMNVGYDPESSLQSLVISEKYDWIDASFGIHPHYLSEMHVYLQKFLEEEHKKAKYLAIGEIGMDSVKSETSIDLQKECFSKQLRFALENNYPVIVHNRGTDQEVLKILQEYAGIRGVMHCYSSNREMAEKYLKLGLFLSFSGNITYKRSIELREVVKIIPKNRILLETDCPYLTPQKYRGKTLNKPSFVEEVYKTCVSMREENIEELSKQIKSNYLKLFHGG
ncbi:MAG: TatD family hydrolase [Caldisericia bacterium]|nr:TatD family hydrolase [Caldisericia bacterium]